MSPTVRIIGPEGGERVIPGPNAVRIVEDGTATGHRLGVGVITMAPHTSGPEPHWHAGHDEGFYVVSGTPRFTDHHGASHIAAAGTWITVPTGAVHSFANPGDDEAVIVNTFTPDVYVQYFRDARALMDSDEPPSPEAAAAIRARYSTYPADEQPKPT